MDLIFDGEWAILEFRSSSGRSMRKAGARKRPDYGHGSEQKQPARQIRVLVADDNPAILEVVGELLGTGFLVVGSCRDSESVLREASALNPDVIVLDISMGDVSGIEVARRLQDTSCHIKIVFLTVHEDAEFVRSALAAGGAAYVFKSRLHTDLIPAINAACSGKLFVSCRNVVVRHRP
jgi:DNA-binding NarL/FixJ family response regulator